MARIIKEHYGLIENEKDQLTATVEEDVLVQIESMRTHPSVAAAASRGEPIKTLAFPVIAPIDRPIPILRPLNLATENGAGNNTVCHQRERVRCWSWWTCPSKTLLR